MPGQLILMVSIFILPLVSSAQTKSLVMTYVSTNSYPACPGGYTAEGCASGNGCFPSATSGIFVGNNGKHFDDTGRSVKLETFCSDPTCSSGYQYIDMWLNGQTMATSNPVCWYQWSPYNQPWGICLCREN